MTSGYWYDYEAYQKAGVAELADALDSKSSEVHSSCGFDPHLQHHTFSCGLKACVAQRRTKEESATLNSISIQVCQVIGRDFQGHQKAIRVEAESVYEAAVRAMDQIRNEGGMVSELKVMTRQPPRAWNVQPSRLCKWSSTYEDKDDAELRDIKKRVWAFLVAQMRQ